MKSSSYIEHKGLYHSFDARAKLVFTVLMVIAVFFVPTTAFLYALVAVFLILSIAEVGLRKAFGNVAIIAPMIAIMFLFMPLNARDGEVLLSLGTFTLVTREALANFLTVTGRFLLISLLCSLLMQTTRADHIMLTLSWFGLPPLATLTLSLSMRFIPDISATFRQIRESQRLRLPSPDEEDERKRPFKSIFPTLVAAIVAAVRSIPSSASAIDLRGYGRKNERGHYKRLERRGATLFIHFLIAIIIPLTIVVLPRLTVL